MSAAAPRTDAGSTDDWERRLPAGRRGRERVGRSRPPPRLSPKRAIHHEAHEGREEEQEERQTLGGMLSRGLAHRVGGGASLRILLSPFLLSVAQMGV